MSLSYQNKMSAVAIIRATRKIKHLKTKMKKLWKPQRPLPQCRL